MRFYKFSFVIIMLILSFTIVINSNEAHGKSHEERQLEEFIKDNDYIPAEKAIVEFEEKYGEKVNLPKKLPFEPSHRFGNIDEEGRLKLHFMRPGKIDKYPTLDFVFYVMPEIDLDLFINASDKVYTLKSGEKAYYRQQHKHFHSLAFTGNKLGYHFGSNPDNIDLDSFIQIAESIR
ncbi:autoinducer [Alkalihalophilus marmarensis]|uniref:autoinducer n=1 Tax=Alkalihalophilus marmarensis TaxID=521377 RepID=UPI002DB9B4B2|nr:autoinducer [Alkalihalophilus marmarensis]MEC2074174.1 autoinducer [Alkalihalophilus marmarensis]